MKVHFLKAPLSEDDVVRLSVGDIVYVSGIIYTARDLTHRKVIQELKRGSIPRELFKGAVIYHAGPVVKRVGNEWRIISIGPTTSIRMESLTVRLLSLAEIRLIVGKGGFGKHATKALIDKRCAYGIFPGGCGVVAAKCVKRVIDVYYLDELGVPEAMWVLEVEKFGPIVISVAPSEGSLH